MPEVLGLRDAEGDLCIPVRFAKNKPFLWLGSGTCLMNPFGLWLFFITNSPGEARKAGNPGGTHILASRRAFDLFS
jgi:hypothetical protein